jgi:hypothetical protein
MNLQLLILGNVDEKKSVVIENGEQHFGMIPIGEIWKNKNFRKNVKACAKISGKTKN